MSENTTPIKSGNKTTSPDRITDNITNYLKSEWKKLGKTGDFPKPSRIYYKDGTYKVSLSLSYNYFMLICIRL